MSEAADSFTQNSEAPIEPFLEFSCDGQLIKFYSLEDIRLWVQEQLNDWKDWRQQIESRPSRTGKRSLRQIYQLENILAHTNADLSSDASVAAAKTNIQSVLSTITSGQILLSRHGRGARVLAVHAIDPNLSLAAWVIETGGAGQVLREQEEPLSSELFGATSMLRSVDIESDIYKGKLQAADAIEARVKNSERELEQLRVEAYIERKLRDDEHKGSLDVFSSKGDDLKIQFDADWDALKKAFREDMKLKASRQYWEEKRVRHKKFAIGWGSAFASITAVAILLLLAFGIDWLVPNASLLSNKVESVQMTSPQGDSFVVSVPIAENSSKSQDIASTTLPRLLVVIIPGFIFIWLLRIIGRQLATHLALMEDATERSTMLLTFLSLLSGEDHGASLSEQDRILILHSLFRPSGSQSHDDAPPAHWFDLLVDRMGNKKN